MDTPTNKTTETQTIVELASGIKPVSIGGEAHIMGLALPPDWTYHVEDREKLLDAPARKKGNVRLDDTESFIAYVIKHADENFTNLYCSADYIKSEVSFRCVFNDHGSGNDDQQWQDYTANYNPLFSEEWKRWIGSNKKLFTQLEFAMFIEENLSDIASTSNMPSGSDLLSMATSFEATQDMKFKSSVRLQNGGIDMSFLQDDNAQTLQKMQMFEKIAIGIPVFWGSNAEAYQITARLRYRNKEGKLVFWYELIRADKVLEDATKQLIEKIKSETKVPMYFGRV